MKILVFSDTHHNTDLMIKALNTHKDDTDLIIHLGDNVSDTRIFSSICPHIANINIRGNCDYNSFSNDVKDEALFKIIGTNINAFACHGHRYCVKDGNDLIYQCARRNSARIAFYGHTHIADITERNGIIIMNPGSASLPRSAEPASYGVVRIENGEILPTILYK